VLIAAAGLLLALTTPAGAAYHLVRVAAGAPGLDTLGLALDHVTRDGTEILFAAGDDDLALLERAGIAYTIETPDLESYYGARLDAERGLREGALRGTGFGFGSMGGYYTWSEVVAKLDEMRADYPDLVTARESLGTSWDGRDLWMVKISDHADQSEGEPAILYTALTHAREPIGMEVLLYYMFHLLESYGTDAEATYLVDEREMFFVPVVNPDGYETNRLTNPNGGGMWRKNRRNNGGGVYGVDLNRNYGYRWGYDNQGSSPTPSSDTYRGPSAFSEPETSAIRGFHQDHAVLNGFHYHAYGNYELHPFAYAAAAFPPEPDRSLYLEYTGQMAALNGYAVGNFYQRLGYLANGEVLDWSYGEQIGKPKIYAVLSEVGGAGDGFWPASSRILPLVEENREPNLFYAWIAGARVSIRGVTAGPSVPAGATSPVVVELDNRGLGAPATDVTVTLASADPYVTIAIPTRPFPPVPALGSATNASDPLEFFVSPAAPVGHVITLTVTARQGPVVRDTRDVQVTVSEAAAVADAAPAAGLRLEARPNPMRGAAELVLSLPAAGPAELVVFDVAGRAVRRLVAGEVLAAGARRIGFDGRDRRAEPLPDGVYVARLTAGEGRAEAKLVIMR
jgi:hypothetical protein